MIIQHYGDVLPDLKKPQSQHWELHISNWHPATINQWDGCHWRKKSRLKANDRQMIWAYARHIPIATRKRTIKLTIILGYKERGCDPDAYWKSTLDALVHNELLVDDSKEWVEILPVQYERSSNRLPATIIRISEAI